MFYLSSVLLARNSTSHIKGRPETHRGVGNRAGVEQGQRTDTSIQGVIPIPKIQSIASPFAVIHLLYPSSYQPSQLVNPFTYPNISFRIMFIAHICSPMMSKITKRVSHHQQRPKLFVRDI
jgi:hypothetical protein